MGLVGGLRPGLQNARKQLNCSQKIPNLKTAGFSLLEPGVSLTPHRGWGDLSNYVLRSHLLLTPNPADSCYVEVAGKRQSHTYGEWITFDDSLVHMAENTSDKVRVVLLIDIDRPSNIPVGTSTIEHSSELDNFIDQM